MRKFKKIYFSRYFTALAALLLAAGGMPTYSWGMAGKTVEKLSGTVARRLTAQGALLRARIAANPTPQAPRPTTLGQLVTRRATQRNLTTQVPQNNYRDYRNYDNYGNSGRYGHARPFNYSALGSLGAATAGFAVANKQPARALVMKEGPTMLSFSFNGYIKNVIFLPDEHFEGDPYYRVSRPIIARIRDNQWESMRTMLLTLSQSPIPTTVYLEHKQWQGRASKSSPFLLDKMTNFAIDNDWHLKNMLIIPIDNRTEEELKIDYSDQYLNTNHAQNSILINKSRDDAQTIIENGRLPQEIKNLLRANMLDELDRVISDVRNGKGDHYYIRYISLKMNALLNCKLWEDLLSDGDKNIIVYAGRYHTRAPLKTLFQAQNQKVPYSLRRETPHAPTIKHLAPEEKEKIISRYIEQHLTAQEGFGAAITQFINQQNKPTIRLDEPCEIKTAE